MKPLSAIFNFSFMRESIQRKGLIASIESGLKLLTIRFNKKFFKTRIGRALSILFGPATSSGSVLYVFYDLGVSAPGFDIINFLVLAEKYRIENHYKEMHVVFVPPEGDSAIKYKANKKMLDSTDYFTRLQTILTPSCYLFASCNGYTVCATRAEAFKFLGAKTATFPPRYTVTAPVPMVKLRYFKEAIDRGESIPSIKAPALMKQAARVWLDSVAKGKKVVTITLRESSYVPDRNSNIEAWGAFARNLVKSGEYVPVFIRDTERVAEKIPEVLEGFIMCPEASINVLFRTAIYEESYLNMVINNGTSMLCLFDKDIRYLFFKVVTPSNPSTTVEFLRKDQGMIVNEDFPGSNIFQKLVWEDDMIEAIEREFKAMCDIIEKNRK